MKCLKGPVPRVVATASGEAAADQEMAHLLLAQDLQIRGTMKVPSEFFRPLSGAWHAPPNGTKTILGTRF